MGESDDQPAPDPVEVVPSAPAFGGTHPHQGGALTVQAPVSGSRFDLGTPRLVVVPGYWAGESPRGDENA